MTDKEITSMSKTLLKLKGEDIDNIQKLVNGGKEKFAADLKARISASKMVTGNQITVLHYDDVMRFIDETLNAEHPTPEQIIEIEMEELP